MSEYEEAIEYLKPFTTEGVTKRFKDGEEGYFKMLREAGDDDEGIEHEKARLKCNDMSMKALKIVDKLMQEPSCGMQHEGHAENAKSESSVPSMDDIFISMREQMLKEIEDE